MGTLLSVGLTGMLCAVKCIYKEAKRAMTENETEKSDLDAESFFPILVYVMVHENSATNHT